MKLLSRVFSFVYVCCNRDVVESSAQLFRLNSVATKLLTPFVNVQGRPWVKAMIGLFCFGDGSV